MQYQSNPTKILRMKQVAERCGVCRALIYRYIRAGKFPAGVRLGERAVGWRESDVESWLASRQSNVPAGL